MTQRPRKGISLDTPAAYCIRCQGELNASWSEYLCEMSISTSDTRGHETITTLVGRVPDQAALLGVLNALYTLGMPLLHVDLVEEYSDTARIERCS